MSQKFIGVTIPFRLGNNGMFNQSTTIIEQTRSNFKNLILTRKGERLHQVDFGCDLWKFLFEQITPDSLENARLSVTDAVDRWLPFLELTNFELKNPVNDNPHRIDITVTYRFRRNPNVTDTVTISV